MDHSEVVCRRQNGDLMVYSKPCITCLMCPLQKEKITKILLDLRFFHHLSVDTVGLKTRKVQTELLMFGPTLQIMCKTLKKPKSKIPGSSSFATLRTAVQDGLIVAKLQLFSSTATIMMPYLQKFQRNAPLVPFMTIEVIV